jgi:hypothetical protein
MNNKILSALLVVASLAASAYGNTNTLFITNFNDVAYVRSGSNYYYLQNVAAKGYMFVKYDPAIAATNTGAGDGKGYFRVDFTGQGLSPNTNASLKLVLRHAKNAGAAHLQLWALNQAATPSLSSPGITWANAPANDVNGFGLLTNGSPYSATLLADFTGGSSATIPDTVTLDGVGPNAWGKFLFGGQAVFALTSPDDLNGTASANGERYAWTNSPATNNMSAEFFDTTGPQPPLFANAPTNMTLYAHHAGSFFVQVVDTNSGGAAAVTVLPFTTGSSTNVVPSNFVVTPNGSGGNTISFTAGVSGTATVKLYIYNTNLVPTLTNTSTFTVTALPNPLIVASPDTNGLLGGVTYSGTSVVSSVDFPVSQLSVTLSNQNPNLSYSSVQFTGTGSNRLVQFTAPGGGVGGLDVLFLTVTDPNTNTYTDDFWVMVRPSRGVLFNDHFDYPTNSAYGYGDLQTAADAAWYPRGTGGSTHIRVTNVCSTCFAGPSGFAALLRQNGTGIPLIADLAENPFPLGNQTKIYTKFTVVFNANNTGTLPTNSSGPIVHLWDGSNMVCGVVVCTNNVQTAGNIRLAIVNSSLGVVTNNNVFPLDLTAGTTYTVVTRYNVDSQTSALWVYPSGTNPTGESDANVTASDVVAAPRAVTSVGMRLDSSLWGDTLLDDLVVGRSFADATGVGTPPPFITGINQAGGVSTVNFFGSAQDTAANFKVYQSTNVAGPYTDSGVTVSASGAGGNFTGVVGASSAHQKFFRIRHN